MRDIRIEGHGKHLAAKNRQDDHDERSGSHQPRDVLRGHGRQRAEEVLIESRGCLARRKRREHDAACDASVEDEGECKIAGGAALGAHEFKDKGSEGGDDERGGHGSQAGQEGKSHTRERDMAHAVAEQREPPLDEEDADEGGDKADERGCHEGTLHEVVSEHAHVSRPQARGRRVRLRA